MIKEYDVFCVTPEPVCGGEIYLGKARFNEGLRCQCCGRWTKPGRIKPKKFATNKEGINMKNVRCDCKEDDQCKCNKCERGIYPLHCNDCGGFLAEVPKATWTYCPQCRRWSRIEPEGD